MPARHSTGFLKMSGSTGLTPLQSYISYSANEAKYANAAARGSAQQTGLINYFQANAAKITTPASLLGNYKVLSVVLGAFGIGNLINSTALVKQLITQDPNSKSSVAYQIGNAKYLAFATALQNWNPPPFSNSDGVNAIVTAYKTNNFEAGVNTQTPGLQNALYFTRIAPSITSLTQLQSDPSLLAVAVTGVGLPLTAYDNLSFTQQTTLLTQKLKIADLQKPAYVQHLAELYLVQQQLTAGTQLQTPQPGSIASLFGGASKSADSVLTILQGSNAGTTSLLGTSTTGTATNPLLSLFA
jgi:Protein of unknown function (DUF1217)